MAAADKSENKRSSESQSRSENASEQTLDFAAQDDVGGAGVNDESRPKVIDSTIGRANDANPQVDQASEFATTPSIADTTPAASNALAGAVAEQNFGDYELLEEIGRGGMGVVYKARQRSLDRTVALKMVLSAEHASDEEMRRFRVEAEAVGKLDHPGIVPVFEVGTSDSQLFYSMGFVEGSSLAERLRHEPLSPREAAELVCKIADAIEHAHSEHIIHRDLKPANILLDKANEPKVTDFGLAKRLDVESDLTMSGQVMGTPSYMAPEQAEGRREKIGPAADVYAMGAILYATLTGRPPFQAAGLPETLRQVVHDEPVPPRRLNSDIDRDLENICLKCLHKHPEQRYSSSGALADEFRRYLRGEPVLARPVTQFERTRRWCVRNPVLSSLSIATLLLLLCLAIGGPLLTISERAARRLAEDEKNAANAAQRHADEEAAAARAAQRRADNEAAAARAAEQRAEEEAAAARTAEQVADTAKVRAEDEAELATLAAFNARLAYLAARVDIDPMHVRGLLHEERRCPEHLRDFTWRHMTRASSTLASTWWMHEGNVFDLAFSPDGKHIASAGREGKVKILKYHPWYPHEEHMELVHEFVCDRTAVSWSPDGQTVLAGSTAYSFASGEVVKQFASEGGEMFAHRFSADGNWIVARIGTPDSQRLAVLDAETGEPRAGFESPEGNCMRFALSPDSRLLVAIHRRSGITGSLALYDLATGQAIAPWSESPAVVYFGAPLAFSPDGRKLASNDAYAQMGVWDVETGQRDSTMVGHSMAPTGVAFSRDGERLTSSGFDGTIRIWNAASGEQSMVLHRNLDSPIFTIARSPVDDRLAYGAMEVYEWPDDENSPTETDHNTTDENETVPENEAVPEVADQAVHWHNVARVLNTTVAPGSLELAGHKSTIFAAELSPDQLTFATASGDKTIKLWDAHTGALRETLEGHTDMVFDLAFTPDGTLLVSSSKDDTVRLWNVTTAAEERKIDVSHHSGRRRNRRWTVDRGSIDVHPNGDLLAAVTGQYTIQLWDPRNGELQRTLTGHKKYIIGATFSPNGETLASFDGEGQVKLWNPATEEVLQEFTIPKGVTDRRIQAGDIRFSPDGKTLAVATHSITDFGVPKPYQFSYLMWWDLESGQMHGPTYGRTSFFYRIAFSPDSQQLAWPVARPTVWLLDVQTGEHVNGLLGHLQTITTVSYSPDGKTVATGSVDRTIRLWDPVLGDERAVLEGHAEPVGMLLFDNESERLYSTSMILRARIWSRSFFPPAD